MYTYCIYGIRNKRIIKNIKEVVGNYSLTKTKYFNQCFNILENTRHFKKQNTTQYTPVLYGTIILAIRVKIFTRSGKVKYRTLKIVLDSGMSTTIISSRLIPKARRKKNTTTKCDTRRGVFQDQAKSTVSFQLPELYHTKTITYVMHVYYTKTINNMT